MKIKSLNIADWNQFENINIEFHPKLTVLTGANGAGKSTLIRILSRLIGWGYNETATPLKSNRRLFSALRKFLKEITENTSNHQQLQIGQIVLETGNISLLVPRQTNSPTYNINYGNNGSVSLRGINIPSHRTPYSYRQVVTIPVRPKSKQEAFNLFNDSLKRRTLSHNGGQNDTPSYHLKETLISLAMFGKGNDFVTGDEESFKLFLGFIDILKILMPPTIGFETINVRDGEVLLETASGEFLLDSVSGGIGSIIDLAWQIYMFDEGKGNPFIVLIDEAENHLHPSMQRSLFPNLIKAFPTAQFIVTTHSPFIVNSVKDSKVYALKYDENNLVVSQNLDFENKSGNASEVLRDVLGVPVTVPVWVEEELNNITSQYRDLELTEATYRSLKADLERLELKEHLPQALSIFQGGK
jgi:predicted ATPase